MILLAVSAAAIGFFHSLMPGHWLPVVLLAKSRKWAAGTVLLGAITAALGHVIMSILLGGISIYIGSHFLASQEEVIERYSSLILVLFGLGFAALAYFRHSSCHGHTHHGPNPAGRRAPFFFLFSLGLFPCVAVLPVFITASVRGSMATVLSMAAFSIGVVSSLMSSSLLASRGLAKLDHPLLEHYGDVATGLGVVLVGLILFWVG